MPGMDGVETTKAMRERGFSMPIVALTGDTSDETVELFNKAGISDILSKPVEFDKLTRALSTWLQ